MIEPRADKKYSERMSTHRLLFEIFLRKLEFGVSILRTKCLDVILSRSRDWNCVLMLVHCLIFFWDIVVYREEARHSRVIFVQPSIERMVSNESLAEIVRWRFVRQSSNLFAPLGLA